MKETLLISAALVALAGSAVAAGTSIVGEYAFTGTQTCVSANSGGFNAALEANNPLAGVSESVASTHGFMRFNYDGTGTAEFNNFATVSYRYFPSTGAGAPEILNGTSKFTYTVTGDEFTVTPVDGSDTGIYTAGSRAGQTFTVTGLPRLVGVIGRGHNTLTMTTPAASVSTQTTSDGSTWQSICSRNRVLIRANNSDG